jgi:hypothetical protein
MQLTRLIFFVTTVASPILALGDVFGDQTILDFSDRRQCSEVRKLEGILSLVNDPDELAQFQERHNLTQSELGDIKAKMTVEQERLKTLQTNTTLMQECAALESGRQLRANCREMRRLAEIIDLAANQTALEDFNTKHDLPADWIAGLLEKATNATAKLKEMNGNSTLVAACEVDTQSLAGKLNIL